MLGLMNYGIEDMVEKKEGKGFVTAINAKYANIGIALAFARRFGPLGIKDLRRSPRQSKAVAPSFLAA